jgi:hypothetical protein
MKNNFNIIAFIMCSAHLVLSASDQTVTKKETSYEFDEFDKSVFYNEVTKKFDTIYPTSFVESISREDVIETDKFIVRRLIYPALVRLVFKEEYFIQLCGNSVIYLERTLSKKNKINVIYSNIKAIEKFADESIQPSIKVSSHKLLQIIQYAAYKIKHESCGKVSIAVSADDTLKVVPYGELKDLINKYSNHEKQND